MFDGGLTIFGSSRPSSIACLRADDQRFARSASRFTSGRTKSVDGARLDLCVCGRDNRFGDAGGFDRSCLERESGCSLRICNRFHNTLGAVAGIDDEKGNRKDSNESGESYSPPFVDGASLQSQIPLRAEYMRVRGPTPTAAQRR